MSLTGYEAGQIIKESISGVPFSRLFDFPRTNYDEENKITRSLSRYDRIRFKVGTWKLFSYVRQSETGIYLRELRFYHYGQYGRWVYQTNEIPESFVTQFITAFLNQPYEHSYYEHVDDNLNVMDTAVYNIGDLVRYFTSDFTSFDGIEEHIGEIINDIWYIDEVKRYPVVSYYSSDYGIRVKFYRDVRGRYHTFTTICDCRNGIMCVSDFNDTSIEVPADFVYDAAIALEDQMLGYVPPPPPEHIDTVITLSGKTDVYTNESVIYSGRLTDANNNPIQDAFITVAIDENEISVSTDEDGRFSISTLFEQPGDYTVSANFAGKTCDNIIYNSSYTHLLITVTESPVPPPPPPIPPEETKSIGLLIAAAAAGLLAIWIYVKR